MMEHTPAQLRQEDVFRSISENVRGSSDPTVLYAVLLTMAGVILVVVAVNALRGRKARPRGVNHEGRLNKEMLRKAGLKKGEVRALRTMAAEQGCSSPLTLVLCPSMLAKGINARGKSDRKWAMAVARRLGLTAMKRDK